MQSGSKTFQPFINKNIQRKNCDILYKQYNICKSTNNVEDFKNSILSFDLNFLVVGPIIHQFEMLSDWLLWLGDIQVKQI